MSDTSLAAASPRSAFRRWLDDHRDELAPFRSGPRGDLESAFTHELGLVRELARGGWTRLGWPEWAGGRGGSPAGRRVVYEELAAAGFPIPRHALALETLVPALVEYAPELASAVLPRYLTGEESWCQGFSEVDAGSDLGALRTRGTETAGGGYRIEGHKIWSSYAHLADRCAMLVRTGHESGPRGLTMLLVDLDSPGVTVRPIALSSGNREVAEIYLDGVEVPADRCIGSPGSGWEVAMFLLQFERGAYAWMRQADLQRRLRELARETDERSPDQAAAIGLAHVRVAALRERCRHTLEQLDRGDRLGPEISIDKVLLATAEQQVFDSARLVLGPRFAFAEDDSDRAWREDWFYSRAASIYGGALEVQRNIIGERLLGLPRETRT